MRTIVVGAGAAGLWAALHAATRGPVVLVAPDPRDSATALAQGGIAAAIAEGDDPEWHAADTMAAGNGLCDRRAVAVLTREGPQAISALVARGMAFDGAPAGEGGHGDRRVLHAGGDATGRFLLAALLPAVRATPGITWENRRAAALGEAGGRDGGVCGVVTEDGAEIEADRVILATGGACGIYGRRTGPGRATGEGMALAWRAGAVLADLEFVQFHPTAMDVPGHPARLLTEALRGEGAMLVDRDGRRFTLEVDRRGELAPRDIVAAAVHRVREETGAPAYLDATVVPDVRARFPTAAAACAEVGLDLGRDRIPVGPAAHYFIGGVLTDVWGRTTVPGLLACGEVAASGVHGANRLASNSLLEALVFGRRAALAPDGPGPRLGPGAAVALPRPTTSLPLEEVRSLADRFLGVVRSGPDLDAVARKLEGAPGAPALLARLVALAALRREESRGAHRRSDRPHHRPEWRVRQAVSTAGWNVLRPA